MLVTFYSPDMFPAYYDTEHSNFILPAGKQSCQKYYGNRNGYGGKCQSELDAAFVLYHNNNKLDGKAKKEEEIKL